jgi:hypothetical protein
VASTVRWVVALLAGFALVACVAQLLITAP